MTKKIKKPKDLKLRSLASIKIVKNRLGFIYTKTSHDPGTEWEEHKLTPPPAFVNFQLKRKFERPLQLDKKKKKGLRQMMAYLPLNKQEFYKPFSLDGPIQDQVVPNNDVGLLEDEDLDYHIRRTTKIGRIRLSIIYCLITFVLL